MENASKALIIAGAILISILLITIGIVLINTGRDVVDTGTSGMTSQKIQTFNSQFTAYEGKRKGSEIRSLINAVNASNATDSEHQIAVYGPVTNVGLLKGSKTYTVEVHYRSTTTTEPASKPANKIAGPTGTPKSEAGYIWYIYIK